MNYEELFIQNITGHFTDKILDAKVKRKGRVAIRTSTETIEAVLLYVKQKLGFIHLSHISCVDWIEENRFELVYIILASGRRRSMFLFMLTLTV